VLLVIVLIIFGPGKLPDVGNAIGRGIREFRRASTDIEDAVRGEPARADTQRTEPPRTEQPVAPAEPVRREPGEQTH
jgi:sec-independent protein translocase protein TatA